MSKNLDIPVIVVHTHRGELDLMFDDDDWEDDEEYEDEDED